MLLIASGCTTNDKKEVTEEEIKVSKVEFKEQAGGQWAMTGTVINVNDYQIQGNVEIVLFNKNDQTISQFSTEVNDGNPIVPGDSAGFQYTADKNTFAGATRYHVKFLSED